VYVCCARGDAKPDVLGFVHAVPIVIKAAVDNEVDKINVAAVESSGGVSFMWALGWQFEVQRHSWRLFGSREDD
jgi:hypothetical protein